MDWNSLVNTATKAINTDEDETTLMDLESEQPTQKSTSRYEMAKKNSIYFMILQSEKLGNYHIF